MTENESVREMTRLKLVIISTLAAVGSQCAWTFIIVGVGMSGVGDSMRPWHYCAGWYVALFDVEYVLWGAGRSVAAIGASAALGALIMTFASIAFVPAHDHGSAASSTSLYWPYVLTPALAGGFAVLGALAGHFLHSRVTSESSS
jgi:hypothetical protein